MFQLIIKNINGQVVEEINYRLNEGNPNVNDVKKKIEFIFIK